MAEWTVPDEFRSDCDACVGLCCVALPLTRGADFPIDKPAGVRCPNLDDDARCARHATLRNDGFRGCVAYECFGAGQQVTAEIRAADELGDRDARDGLVAAFPSVQRLQELRYLVAEANALIEPLVGSTAHALGPAARELAADLRAPDADEHELRPRVGVLLDDVSRAVREARGGLGPDLRGRDLAGAKPRGADLRRADLRGALLLGADLRDADLRDADFLGADLRGAQLEGADLRGALFLTPPQLAAARR